jgi:hypothetical protein
MASSSLRSSAFLYLAVGLPPFFLDLVTFLSKFVFLEDSLVVLSLPSSPNSSPDMLSSSSLAATSSNEASSSEDSGDLSSFEASL